MSDVEMLPSTTDREPPFPTDSKLLDPPPTITPTSDTVPTVDPSSTILPSDVNGGSRSNNTPPSQTEEDSSSTAAPPPSISTYRTMVSSFRTTRSVEPSTWMTPTNNGWVTSIRTSRSSSTAASEVTQAPAQESVRDEPVSQSEAQSTSDLPSRKSEEGFPESGSAPAVSSEGDASQSRVTSAVRLQATAGARLPSTASISAIANATPLDGTNEELSPDEPSSNEDSLDGSAKAGLAVGILTAVCAIILGIFLFRKRVIAKRRRKYLKRHSNMFQHGRNQSDFSWSGKERPWSTGGSEKSDQDQRDRNTAPASGAISYLNEPPRVDMFESVTAPLADPTSDWPKWMQQFSPARPPSADPSEASTPYPNRDLRISIVAPSPISSNGTVFGQHSTHSRASSTLSGNHLHPIYAQTGYQNRPSSARSRESLATINTSSGEPSPVLSQMTSRFPLPMTTKFGPSEGATAFTTSGWERSKPLGSNNPFRNSMVVPSHSVDRSSQKSPGSDDGGRNPFELELETATLNIDFTQVGVTPPRSGNSTINPTTPITPMPRRKSTSSLSLYSEEGHSVNLNPFDIGSTQPESARAITLEDQSARDSYTEALDLAPAAKQNFWPVPEAYSAQSSRRPSYTSERSGPDPAAWADELAEHNIQTPKTFSRILEMYAGRAM